MVLVGVIPKFKTKLNLNCQIYLIDKVTEHFAMNNLSIFAINNLSIFAINNLSIFAINNLSILH